MSDNATPERLWASYRPLTVRVSPIPVEDTAEYIRGDIFNAQFAKLEAIRAVVHRWIDGKDRNLDNGGGMLEILEILYPTPLPTGTKKGIEL